MKLSKLQRLVVLTSFALGMLTAATVGSPANAAEANCKTVTQNMVRPDSGTGPDWAIDTFTRTVEVCVIPVEVAKDSLVAVTSATYSVKGTDTGTFVTTGTTSFAGAPMVPGVGGTFTGTFAATYTAPYDSSNPTVWPFWAPSGGNGDSTTPWVAKLWAAGANAKGDLTSWGWDYVSCNEKLTNASTGNKGDITGKNTKDIDKCLKVTYKVRCDGKVDVTVVNTLAAGIKVDVSWSKDKQTLKLGENVFTGVATVEGGWVRIDYNGRRVFEAKCLKPTVCATPTPTATATPTVAPTTPPPPTSAATSTAPAPVLADRLPVTGTSGGNPVPWLAGSGVALVALGAGLMFLVWRNRRQPQVADVTDTDPGDTVTFYPHH